MEEIALAPLPRDHDSTSSDDASSHADRSSVASSFHERWVETAYPQSAPQELNTHRDDVTSETSAAASEREGSVDLSGQSNKGLTGAYSIEDWVEQDRKNAAERAAARIEGKQSAEIDHAIGIDPSNEESKTRLSPFCSRLLSNISAAVGSYDAWIKPLFAGLPGNSHDPGIFCPDSNMLANSPPFDSPDIVARAEADKSQALTLGE